MTIDCILERPQGYGTVDYDGLWKKLINELFEEFVLFFAADLFEEIDFLREPEFLQQELFQEIIQEKKGKQVADQIVKVFLKNGKEKWILIHIEVQGDHDLDFSKRMFQYYYRIFDKYDQDIVAIALLTDASKNFHPNMYHRSTHGTELTYKYNIYKFTDQDESELMKSANPFAMAVLAGKYANVTKSDIDQRYHFKRKLFHLVLQKIDYLPEQRRFYLSTLIYFIDYLLKIPLELTQKLQNEMILSKEEFIMMYLDRKNPPPTVGEIIEEGLKEVALEMLKDGISVEIVAKYVKLPIEVLEKLEKDIG